MKKSFIIVTIFLGIILGECIELFIIDSVWERKHIIKYIDLPEEFNQIQSGDTIDVYNINDTVFIRFIPSNSHTHNKTIVKI